MRRVGSSTAPVEEIIKHRENGLLVDFFSPLQIAESIAEVINNRTLARELGEAARNTVLKQFKLESVCNGNLG